MPTTSITREPGADINLATFHNSTIAGALRVMARGSEFDDWPFTRRLINEAADRLDRDVCQFTGCTSGDPGSATVAGKRYCDGHAGLMETLEGVPHA